MKNKLFAVVITASLLTILFAGLATIPGMVAGETTYAVIKTMDPSEDPDSHFWEDEPAMLRITLKDETGTPEDGSFWMIMKTGDSTDSGSYSTYSDSNYDTGVYDDTFLPYMYGFSGGDVVTIQVYTDSSLNTLLDEESITIGGVSTDESSYAPGDVMEVSALAEPDMSDVEVEIEYASNGTTLYSTTRTADQDGWVNFTYSLPHLDVDHEQMNVTVTVGDDSDTVYFSIATYENLYLDPLYPSFHGSTYGPGETVVATMKVYGPDGSLDDPLEGMEVSLNISKMKSTTHFVEVIYYDVADNQVHRTKTNYTTIYDPYGYNTVMIDQPYADDSGHYSVEFEAPFHGAASYAKLWIDGEDMGLMNGGYSGWDYWAYHDFEDWIPVNDGYTPLDITDEDTDENGKFEVEFLIPNHDEWDPIAQNAEAQLYRFQLLRWGEAQDTELITVDTDEWIETARTTYLPGEELDLTLGVSSLGGGFPAEDIDVSWNITRMDEAYTDHIWDGTSFEEVGGEEDFYSYGDWSSGYTFGGSERYHSSPYSYSSETMYCYPYWEISSTTSLEFDYYLESPANLDVRVETSESYVIWSHTYNTYGSWEHVSVPLSANQGETIDYIRFAATSSYVFTDAYLDNIELTNVGGDVAPIYPALYEENNKSTDQYGMYRNQAYTLPSEDVISESYMIQMVRHGHMVESREVTVMTYSNLGVFPHEYSGGSTFMPGDDVRIWTRVDGHGDTPFPGADVSINITYEDPDTGEESEIYSDENGTTGADGTWWSTYSVPSDAEHGEYTVNMIRFGESVDTAMFHVEPFTLNVYANMEKDAYKAGDTATAYWSLTNGLDGSPISGATIYWNLTWDGGSTGNIISSGTIATDDQHMHELSIPLPNDLPEGDCRIEMSAKRPGSEQNDDAYALFEIANQWVTITGEDHSYPGLLQEIQLTGTPFSTIHLIVETGTEGSLTTLDTADLITDVSGDASYHFVVDEDDDVGTTYLFTATLAGTIHTETHLLTVIESPIEVFMNFDRETPDYLPGEDVIVYYSVYERTGELTGDGTYSLDASFPDGSSELLVELSNPGSFEFTIPSDSNLGYGTVDLALILDDGRVGNKMQNFYVRGGILTLDAEYDVSAGENFTVSYHLSGSELSSVDIFYTLRENGYVYPPVDMDVFSGELEGVDLSGTFDLTYPGLEDRYRLHVWAYDPSTGEEIDGEQLYLDTDAGSIVLNAPTYYTPGEEIEISYEIVDHGLSDPDLRYELATAYGGETLLSGEIVFPDTFTITMPASATGTYEVIVTATDGTKRLSDSLYLRDTPPFDLECYVTTESKYVDGAYEPGDVITIHYKLSQQGDDELPSSLELVYGIGTDLEWTEVTEMEGDLTYTIPEDLNDGTYNLFAGTGEEDHFTGNALKVSESPSALGREVMGGMSLLELMLLIFVIVLLVLVVMLFKRGTPPGPRPEPTPIEPAQPMSPPQQSTIVEQPISPPEQPAAPPQEGSIVDNIDSATAEPPLQDEAPPQDPPKDEDWVKEIDRRF